METKPSGVVLDGSKDGRPTSEIKEYHLRKASVSRAEGKSLAETLFGVLLVFLLTVTVTLELIKTLAEEAAECSRKRTEKRRRFPIKTTQDTAESKQSSKQQDQLAGMNPEIQTPTSSMEQVALGYPVLQMILPVPGTPGAPFFDGKNVTEFLETLSDMYDDAGVKDKTKKVKRLVRYCGPRVAPWVKTLVEYDDGDWEGLKTVLFQEYKRTDDAQIRNSTGFLEQLKNKPRTEDDDIGLYCRQFQGSSQKLVKAGRLSRFQECEWFVAGLPLRMRTKAAKAAKILDEESEPDMASAVKYVLDEQRARRKVSELGRPVDASHLIDEPNRRTDGKQASEGKSDNIPLVRDGAIVAPTIAIPAVSIDADSLVEKFGQLSINSANATTAAIMELARALKQPPNRLTGGYQQRAGFLDPARNRSGDPMPQDMSDKRLDEQWSEYFRRTGRCTTCEGRNHYANACPTAQRLMDEGKIHRNRDGRLCPGPEGSGNAPFSLIGVQGGLLRAINAWLVQSMKESEIQPIGGISSLHIQIDDTDEEYNEQALFGIAASQVNAQAKKSAATRPTLSGRIDKEKRLPAARAQRRGAYVAGDGDADRDGDSQETIQNMEDVQVTEPPEAPANANTRTRRTRFEIPDGPQKLERIIRGTTRAGKLAELVLKAPVGGSEELTVEDVLAGSTETRMLIFNKKKWEAGEEGKAVLAAAADAEVANINISEEGLLHIEKMMPTSNEPTPMFDVEIAGRDLVALYDTGAMVNMISKSLADELNLRIHPIQRVTVSAWDGDTRAITGMVKHAVISVRGEAVDEESQASGGRIRVPGMIFIANGFEKGYDLILGQPFRKTSRSGIGYNGNDEDVMVFRDPSTKGEIVVRPRFLNDDDNGDEGGKQRYDLNAFAG